MKLIIGAANSGKTHRVIDRVASSIKSGRAHSILVVPSRALADVARARLAQALEVAELPSRLANRVTTFNSLYLRVLHRAGRRVRLIDSAERRRLIQQSIESLHQERALSSLSKIAGTTGLLHGIAAIFEEVASAGISADQLHRLARGPKDIDIALIFKHYTATLSKMEALEGELIGGAALEALQERRLRRPFAL